ncbi:hypothetical protein HID58_041406, partial [Brassica napus]
RLPLLRLSIFAMEDNKKRNPNSHECLNSWSELPLDLLNMVFKRLGFVDFQRAKSVCSSWLSSSRQSVPKKNHTPWLILFREEQNNSYCKLFNPEEKERLYKTQDTGLDFSKSVCEATYGSWLLMHDLCYNLHILGVTKEKRTKPKNRKLSSLFWIDEKTKDYVVVCSVQIPDTSSCLDMVYKDHKLYLTCCGYFSIFDFYGETPQQTFQRELKVESVHSRQISSRLRIVADSNRKRPHGSENMEIYTYDMVIPGYQGITVLAIETYGFIANSIYFSVCDDKKTEMISFFSIFRHTKRSCCTNLIVLNFGSLELNDDENNNNNYPCTLFNPEERDKRYKTQDLGLEFANSFCISTYGSWLLMRHPLRSLYVVNLFTNERINLPSVESQLGMVKVERTLDGYELRTTSPNEKVYKGISIRTPVFWIDERTNDYVVIWGLRDLCVVYSKKRDTSWTQLPKTAGCVDVCGVIVERLRLGLVVPTKLVVTVTGEVFKVEKWWRPRSETWSFRVIKVCSLGFLRMRNHQLVGSLGDESMLLDQGITVLGNDGFIRDSIYFSVKRDNTSSIFVFNLKTKKTEPLHNFDCSYQGLRKHDGYQLRY